MGRGEAIISSTCKTFPVAILSSFVSDKVKQRAAAAAAVTVNAAVAVGVAAAQSECQNAIATASAQMTCLQRVAPSRGGCLVVLVVYLPNSKLLTLLYTDSLSTKCFITVYKPKRMIWNKNKNKSNRPQKERAVYRLHFLLLLPFWLIHLKYKHAYIHAPK